jgi:hypothetical protein
MTLQSRLPASPEATMRPPVKDTQIRSHQQNQLISAPKEQKEISFIPSFLRKK